MKNDKQYLVTGEELKRLDEYVKHIHPINYMAGGWIEQIKSKQPVKTLDRKEVEKILTKGLKFCLKRNEKSLIANPTYDEEGNVWLVNIAGIVSYLLPKICSLVIPKQRTLARDKIVGYINRNRWLFECSKYQIETAKTEAMKKEIQKNTDYEWEKLIDFICSLIIPKKKIIKALKGTFGHYYKVVNKKFYAHVANEILKEE